MEGLMDRKQAKEQGLKQYDGKSCKRCNTTIKYVSNWSCVKCSSLHQPSADARKRYEQSAKGKAVRKKMNQSDAQKERIWEYNNTSGNATKYYRDNPEKYLEYRVQKYGLTTDEYNYMLTEQNNCCMICNKSLDLGKHTHIDHCHTTLKVRGILCSSCNTGLGLLKEDVNIMQEMINYVNRAS
tara:strand:+ start:125 stop:673 length:549 start_codon:yes stop_codon:yes gene_type:complete